MKRKFPMAVDLRNECQESKVAYLFDGMNAKGYCIGAMA